jgi:serine/threonine protein kinase
LNSGDVSVIGKTLGNLRIVSKIGEGGMGVVYLAEHIALKKRFAVKCLTAALTENPGFRERFYQEAVSHASLDHPNIVHATDFFEEGGQFFFVMEYVNGQGLNDLIKMEKLTEKETLSIFKGILSGLDFAHSKGVIHRDVKPSNVIVDEAGRARITDFGIAILVGEKRLTATGANVGTSCYMSPEQILHPKDIDHRSDVYSAGIVLYEMLTGDVPFDGETEFTIKNKQVKEPVPDPAKKNPLITAQLKKIMMKALEKNPDKRFSGCGEFLQSIENYEKEIEITKPGPQSKLPWVFALVAMVSVLVVAYWAIKNNGEPTIPVQPDEKAIHEAAYIWIESATEKASIICREIKMLKLKQQKLQTGINALGDTADLDSLKKQIREHENNINEYLGGYSDFIAKLSGVESAIVDKELNKYNESLAQKALFPRIKITLIVLHHYQESLKRKLNLNIDVMNGLCPAQ